MNLLLSKRYVPSQRLEFKLRQPDVNPRNKKAWERASQETKLEIEKLISNDMESQKEMAIQTGAVLSSLKYRLPWPLKGDEEEDYEGLAGFLCEQIENRVNSTEGRLLVTPTNADDIYNGLRQPAKLHVPSDTTVVRKPPSYVHTVFCRIQR